MKVLNRSRTLIALAASVSLSTCSACRREAPPPAPISRPAATSQAATPAPAVPATMPAAPVAGGELNRFFPASGIDGTERVFTQEKDGLVLAELSRGGKKVATLSISDTSSTPGSLGKYETSTKRIAGLPAAEIGSNATGVLVAKRYQVQVRSNDPAFTASDREAWIQKFQLAELAAYVARGK